MSDTEEPTVKKSIDSSVLGKLTKFDGKSSVQQFIRSVTKRAKLEKWTDEEKTNITKYLCTGFAETFIDSQPDLEECNFKELSLQLVARFRTKLSTPDAYAQLLQIKQHRRSIEEYAEEIETTAANVADVIDDLKNSEKRNELLISVFISGLDNHIKRLLTASEFDEFTEIIHAAKRCADTFTDRSDTSRNVGTIDREHSRYSREQWVAPGQQPHRPFTQLVCWQCNRPGHVQRECNSRSQRGRFVPRHNSGPRFQNPINNSTRNQFNSHSSFNSKN